VRQAAEQGRVSRAHFKLRELDERFGLLRPGQRVLELGAAPGGWTRYVEDRIEPGRGGAMLVACDPRPVSARADTVVIEGAFGEPETDAALAAALGESGLHLVLSDMAPNISGVRATDQARAMHLVDLALEAAETWLEPGGGLVVKVFQGEGVDAWVGETRKKFAKFRLVKPKSSRTESREVFAVAQGFAGSG
jgi:23S rRNA (uridine2552-2'-O)-methyltransferase